MDLIDAHEAYFGILGGLYKTDKLGDGTIQHADDKLGRDHDAEGDISIDYGYGAEEGDGHVLHAVDKL